MTCSRANVVRFSMSLQLFTRFGMVPLYWAIIEGARQSLIPHSCSVCRTVLTLCHESLFCEYNDVFNSAYDALLLKRSMSPYDRRQPCHVCFWTVLLITNAPRLFPQ
jgi:hypothetical protein